MQTANTLKVTHMKVAIYIRVSTEEQALEGTSLDSQLEYLREYCNRHSWDIVQEYRDPGFSGKDDDRPGLRQLLWDAENGMFEGVVVARLDRLARNLRLLLELEERLKGYDVGLYSVKESVDTSTAIGRTVFQVLGLVAEWEREAIVERTRGGRLRRYKEGGWGPGKVIYGYRYDQRTKRLVINEEQARVVRRIFNLYVSGKGMEAICSVLNTEGIPPRSSRAIAWHSGAIRDIIVNPAYKGEQIVSRHCPISELRHGIPEDAIMINIPSIVDNDTWEMAYRHLSSNKHIQPARVNLWLLQGLVICGKCGHTFRSDLTYGTRYYGCTGRLKRAHRDGSPRCTNPRLNADWLEEQVWSRIEAILSDPNQLEQLIAETVEQLKERETELYNRIRPIDMQLEKIAEKKGKLAEDWIAGALERNKVDQMRRQLEAEETRLKSLRGETDPNQLRELQYTQAMLRFWQKQLATMEWSLEEEDGRRILLYDEPRRTAKTLAGLEDKEITSIMHFPATKREMLDRLQVRVVVFDNRAEVNAIFPIETIEGPLCSSTCRSDTRTWGNSPP